MVDTHSSTVAFFWGVALSAALLPIKVTAPVNGIIASTLKYPFVAGLIDTRFHRVPRTPFCTGTIVTSKFVLTSANCIKTALPVLSSGRQQRLRPEHTIVLYGTTYSPTYTLHTVEGRTPPSYGTLNVQLDPNSKPGRPFFDARQAIKFHYPNQADLEEAFKGDPDEEKILKEGNEYFEYPKAGKEIDRYRLNFALVELQIQILWNEDALPAIFPLQIAPMARQWWKKRVYSEYDGSKLMESCVLIGWGGWVRDNAYYRTRLKYTEVKWVPTDNCELSWCATCAWCNKSLRFPYEHYSCYKSIYNTDATVEDEGAPVWCPWAGITVIKGKKKFQTGAVVGVLGRPSCYDFNVNYTHSVPSVYGHTWDAYNFISRIVNYTFPPNIIVYEDALIAPTEKWKEV